MKKLLSLLLLAALIVTMFVGCGEDEAAGNAQNGAVKTGTFSEYLVVEKVGTINKESFFTAAGGLYYKENDAWGIMSHNGARDTGAIYSSISTTGNYFIARTREFSNFNDIAGLNSASLVDGKGKTYISGYAAYYELNERYVKVVKVTERTYSEDDLVASATENGLCFTGKFGDDAWYKGNWYVFDTVTETFVPGATGTADTFVSANGRYVQFSDANNNSIKINEKGEPLPENSRLFDDGSYKVETKIGEMYDADGNLLFNYDLTGFVPSSYENGYYSASKYEDGESKYVVMDRKGNIISSEFDEYFTIYGEIVACDGKIYNLEGKNIIDGTYDSVYFDKVFNQNWLLRKDKQYTMIDKNGAVYFTGSYKGDYTIWTSEFLASKKTKDSTYYYSHKDKDYTIEGYGFAPWIVKTSNSNSLYNLVDTMTGKTLLEGYKSYDSVSRRSLAYYVYAKYNGGTDVYLVVSGAQLKDVVTKKANLFDDLIAAFETEGIAVTVNKENGEIALDSSVLFGGDSAELTASGKTFLNKFIKAYTTVAFSEKYEGFISKTMVEGHTAPVKGSTYASGLQLSEERALNVKNYCLSAETGVDVSKISKSLENVGYSNSQPVYDKDGKVNMAASRRVSFRFIVNVDF